jgi:hypothetical protein
MERSSGLITAVTVANKMCYSYPEKEAFQIDTVLKEVVGHVSVRG